MAKPWERMSTGEKLDTLFTDVNRLFDLSNEEIQKREMLEKSIVVLMHNLSDLKERVIENQRKKMA